MGEVNIHVGVVPIVIAFVVIVEVVIMFAVTVEAFVINDDIIPIVAVLMTAELVKKADVERIEGILER